MTATAHTQTRWRIATRNVTVSRRPCPSNGRAERPALEPLMSTGACMPGRSSGLLGDQSDGRILGKILRFPAWQQPRAQKQEHADSQQNESQSDEDARVGEIAEHAQVPLRID